MTIDEHNANRAWAFQALDEMRAFLADPDFEGDGETEASQVDQKRKELEDGKYRIVVLGAFNVGKSAMINAFLGDEYLPMVLEECTTKTTHIVKADLMSADLNLTAPASVAEIEELSKLIDALNVDAVVLTRPDSNVITISYNSSQSRDLLKSLRPLVTVSADEDFPQLKSLRDKFSEISICLPNDLLEDDVALVDSPGVHTMSETNERIAEEIIPNSHVVCCLVDSQYAGNQQNRDFIERLAKHRHRKLFFVINKSDQLNRSEIDPRGHRGPAKDLMRSLNGIVENPEIFFISSLYALIAQQLRQNTIGLTDIDENNKVKIPFALQRQLVTSEDPVKDIADYLFEQCNITAFRTRLLEYLYNENREGAVLEAVCRFLDKRTWVYARPLQMKLEMCRDVPRLDELQVERERLTEELETTETAGESVMDTFEAITSGATVNDVTHKGYEALVDDLLNQKSVTEQLVVPLRAWLRDGANFRKARKNGFALLKSEVEGRIDAFLHGVNSSINAEVDAVENQILTQAGSLQRTIGAKDRGYIEAARAHLGAIKACLCGSYFGFMVLGAAVVGGAGAYKGNAGMIPPIEMLPPIDLTTGAIAGAVVGAVLGLILRAITAKGSLRRKLDKVLAEKLNQILLEAGQGPAQVPPVREQLKELLLKRRDTFAEAVQLAFDKETGRLQKEMDAVVEEEEMLLRKQQEIIERVEPKLEKLIATGQKAGAIAKASAPVENVA